MKNLILLLNEYVPYHLQDIYFGHMKVEKYLDFHFILFIIYYLHVTDRNINRRKGKKKTYLLQ